MNRIQKQESENEVQLQQIRGVIDEEKARGELLSIQAENSNKRSKMEGMVEAERVISFLDEIGKAFPNMDDGTKISLWNTLRKEDALKAVATSNAKLYFTPAEVNLSIEKSAWKAFNTEFYPTYNLYPAIKEKLNNKTKKSL